MYNHIRRIKYLVFLVLAGTCTGIFFYVRSFPFFRLYLASGTDPGSLWAAGFLPRAGLFVLLTNLGLIGVWVVYAAVCARALRQPFRMLLRLDAYTYLPLCLLALVVFQGDAVWMKGFILLSQIAGNILVFLTVLIVVYLKVRNYERLRGTTVPAVAVAARVKSPPGRKQKLAIFVISLAVYLLVGFRIEQHLPLGGDEPHYLLITHSLFADRDLAIINNYKQRDYEPFFQAELQPHLSIGKDGTRYPGHPIGLPLLLLPVYVLTGGRQGAIVLMNVLAAFLALQLYLLAFSVTRNKRLALLLWGVVSFTSPLLLYSSQIYPEVPSALFLIIAYRGITERNREHPRLISACMTGASLAIMPWMQQRMLLPAIMLAGYHLIVASRRVWKKRRHQQHLLLEGIPIGLLVLSGLLMAGFYYHLYRNPMPNAPYISVGMPSIFSLDILLREGFLGLLLDQEAGLLMFSPYYVFLVAGFVLLLQKYKVQTFWLAGLMLSVYIPCAGFILEWRGAWSPASRYMVVLIPLAMPLLGEALSRIPHAMYRYVFFFLVAISFGWSGVFLQTPSLSIMRGKGVNALLEYFVTATVDSTRFFPACRRPSVGMYLLSGMWVLIMLGFSWCFVRAAKRKHAGVSPAGLRMNPERMIRARVRHIFGSYGLLVAGLLVFATIAEYTPSYANPSVARNHYLRDFLRHLNHYAWFFEHASINAEELQFQYVSREKRGRVTDTSFPRFIVAGPHEWFPRGEYIAHFHLLVSDNSKDEEVARIEVVAGLGTRGFSTKELRGTDFQTAGEYEGIPLEFQLREDVTDLETRVFFHNLVDVTAKDIIIRKNLSECYYWVGMSAFWDENYEKARTFFSLVPSGRYRILARYQLGIIEQRFGNRESAQALFQQVVEELPDLADAHYRLAVVLIEQQELGRAQHHLEAAVELMPTHLDAWKALQALYKQAGQNELATTAKQTIDTLYHPQYPHTVNWGNQVMFLGYSMNNISQGKLVVEYYWKAVSPMDRGYVTFVHFKQSGEMRFQQDHLIQPIDTIAGEHTFHPTDQWQMGELIRERFEIEAPPGTYSVSFGVWDPTYTKKRLPVLTSSQKVFQKKTTLDLQNITIE